MAEDSATDPRNRPPLRHRSFFLDEALHHYVVSHSAAPDDIQTSLIETTAALGPLAFMQVASDQGAFLSLVISAIRPLLVIEIETFTGYSSLAIARALPEGGHLLCCDVSEEWTAVARRHWEAARVADRINLVIGPAAATLAGLPAKAQVDFAFIDADKRGYVDYYEALVPRPSPHGLIAVDNVLWSSRVVDPDAQGTDTVAIRAFNDHVAADPRVEAVMLSVGSGVTLIGRRKEVPTHG